MSSKPLVSVSTAQADQMVADTQGKTGILFIHPWTNFFGAETSLYLLIKYLNREIYHPVVVLPDEGPLWGKLQTLDVPVFVSGDGHGGKFARTPASSLPVVLPVAAALPHNQSGRPFSGNRQLTDSQICR